ncbi:hypothetical protein Tco_0218973 [Tanacetum coccineum]
MNFTSTNYHTKEELRGKGIKSPSKLLSLKYMSQSSLEELSKNPSSPKRVHFVNSIIILNKEDEAKEEGSVKSGSTEYRSPETTDEIEDKVKSEEEVEEETEEETKEEEDGDLKHFDTFPTMNELRLYLMRRSLEVLRKFHLTILGGRSNQLSHVSSPLLSKPWEY